MIFEEIRLTISLAIILCLSAILRFWLKPPSNPTQSASEVKIMAAISSKMPSILIDGRKVPQVGLTSKKKYELVPKDLQ